MKKSAAKKPAYLRLLPFYLFLLLAPLAWGDEEAAPPERRVEDRRRDTLRFGTETEIANLVQTLRSENVSLFDAELIEIAENTRNRNILSGIFNFFGETEKSGLEDRAIRAVQERDYEANEAVLAAVDYLGRLNVSQAAPALKELIMAGENRFLTNAIRALGRAARGQEETADDAALFLLNYYNNRSPSSENQREIVDALGETGSQEAVPFLIDLIADEEDRFVLRMAALNAVSRIGAPQAMEAVVAAVSSEDPNVRASAIAALGPFSGEAAEEAILDGFRDSFFRSRIGAAQAAGQRRLESAVPFLRFRAENDDVPAVRDEAIRALGAINNSESMNILNALFSGRGNSDRTRLLAAEMLLRNDADTYGVRVAVEMDDAQARNQTALYNGFIRTLTTARTESLEALARRLVTSGGVIERSLALDLILNNEFRSLANEVRGLLDERRHGVSLSRKARNTLERLGLEIEADT